MEKNRGTKMLAVIALIVAVVGLSVGFAAFSNTLTISSSATVNTTNNFYVWFSSSSSALATDPVSGQITPNDPVPTGVSATSATISNADPKAPTITNLGATFTQPGQSVKYEFYVMNQMDYSAFLRQIEFLNVSGASATKTCTAASGTTQSLVDSACTGISLSVKVGSMANGVVTTTNVGSNNELVNSTPQKVTVVISYAPESATADGDFNVSFGNVRLHYSSVNGATWNGE